MPPIDNTVLQNAPQNQESNNFTAQWEREKSTRDISMENENLLRTRTRVKNEKDGVFTKIELLPPSLKIQPTFQADDKIFYNIKNAGTYQLILGINEGIKSFSEATGSHIEESEIVEQRIIEKADELLERHKKEFSSWKFSLSYTVICFATIVAALALMYKYKTVASFAYSAFKGVYHVITEVGGALPSKK